MCIVLLLLFFCLGKELFSASESSDDNFWSFKKSGSMMNAVHMLQDLVQLISKVCACGVKVGFVFKRALVERNILPVVNFIFCFPAITM
jgi:hypothetical protein